MQTDAVQVRKECQHHPFRISRPVVTLAVSMTLFNYNGDLATQVAETKNPHQPKPVREHEQLRVSHSTESAK